jgi:hypothetical protein
VAVTVGGTVAVGTGVEVALGAGVSEGTAEGVNEGRADPAVGAVVRAGGETGLESGERPQAARTRGMNR